MEIEAFITAHPKDFSVLPNCIRSLRDFVSPRPESVTVIAEKQSKDLERILKTTGAKFLSEDEILPGCKRNSIPQIICNGEDRSGWYFQQLLKWGLARISRHPLYMVVDADILFIRSTPLYSENRTVLYRTGQHHRPYFQTFEKLFGYRPARQHSFIANYMLIDVQVIQEMLTRVEERTSKVWHEIILETIDHNTMSSFSEYETYGYYLSRFYPDSFVSQKSATLNLFSFLYPLHDLMARLTRGNFHSIAYHNYNR